MNDQRTETRPRAEHVRPPLERTQQLFLLARAQLAAESGEPKRLEAARRKWPAHRRRFN
jgi:hypothetical protein